MTALGIALLVGIALAQPIVRASWPDAFQRRPPTEKSGGDALAVVMLLDISRGSWPLRDLIDLKDAVGRALATSLRDGDWVAVGSISDQLRMPEALTTMPTNLPPLLREPFDVSWGARHGNTPIWDAVDRSVGLRARAPSAARRIVLLYTSGRPAGNVLPLSEAVARARAARVAVHAAVRPTFQARLKQHGSTDVLWIRPELLLQELTTGTGGALVTADVLSASGLRDVFTGLLSDARNRVAVR